MDSKQHIRRLFIHSTFYDNDSTFSKNKLQIIKDIHASGHAGLKDHKKMLQLVNPEYVIPAHAGFDKAKHIKMLCDDIKIGKTILTKNGEKIDI